MNHDVSRGFSLLEVLIVVTVIGILASIAYPAYRDHTTKTRRAEGKIELLEIMQAQREYYLENNTFTTDLINDLQWPDDAGMVYSENNFYAITAAACNAEALTECVELTATAQPAQQHDGNLTYNSRNVKTPIEKWN